MGGNYTALTNSTNEIGTAIEEFNDSSVTSIDDISLASHGGNNVVVLLEWQ